MQGQTLPEPTTAPAEPAHYRVTIPGAFAYAEPTLTIPAPHNADEIARVILAELTEVGYADLDVTVDLPAGVARIVWQGGPLDAPITGPGVGAPAEPDYWQSLADDLRQVADRIATLAGTGLTAPTAVGLYILGNGLPSAADRTVPMVDAIAAAVGVTASRDRDGTQHKATATVGRVGVHPYTFVPKPDVVAELKAARARIAELEAQQQTGGTR